MLIIFHFASLTPGCSLPRNQVPEWAASYINYKGLKKLVKAAAETAKLGETVDLAGGRHSRLASGLSPRLT